MHLPDRVERLGAVDPTKVNVEIGGKTILQDPTNGWTYDNPQTPTEIVLHGAACTDTKGDLTAKVSIVLGCKTQTVVHLALLRVVPCSRTFTIEAQLQNRLRRLIQS